MSDIESRIDELLNRDNQNLWASIRDTFSNAQKKALDLAFADDWKYPHPDDRIDLLRENRGRDEWGRDPLFDRLKVLFQRNVCDQFGNLPPIAAADLAHVAIAQLTGLNWDNADEISPGIRRFQAFSRAELDFENEGKRRFSLNADHWPWVTAKGAKTSEICPSFVLWSSHTGFELRAKTEPIVELKYYRVKAFLIGNSSDRAMESAERRLGLILESIARTVELSVTLADQERGEEPSTLGAMLGEKLPAVDASEVFSRKHRPTFVPLKFLTEGHGAAVMKSSLSAYFFSEDYFQDLGQRLQNATMLLAHADQTPSDPIAPALSFAAVESLICSQDEKRRKSDERSGISKQIRDCITCLFRSKPNEQAEKQREALKNLYNLRSEVLHGRRLAASKEARRIVRRIAAGAVRAICVWRKLWYEAHGEHPAWKDLKNEINSHDTDASTCTEELPDLSELLPTLFKKH